MKTTPIILSLITNEDETKQESTMLAENSAMQCDKIIYIDVTTFTTPLDLDNWNIKNKDYITTSPPQVQGQITIDVNKIPQPDFPRWLVENQNHISYNLTSNYIECAHKITDPATVLLIEKAKEHSRLKLKDLKKLVTEAGGDFSRYNYEKYVSFSPITDPSGNPSGNKMTLNLMDFEVEMSCFSFPLLRKIVSKGMDDENEFVFKLMDFGYSNNKLAVVFAYEVNKVISGYYDFSYIPGTLSYNKEYTAI